MNRKEKELLSKAILTLHNSMEYFVSGIVFAYSGDENKSRLESERSDNLFEQANKLFSEFIGEEYDINDDD